MHILLHYLWKHTISALMKHLTKQFVTFGGQTGADFIHAFKQKRKHCCFCCHIAGNRINWEEWPNLILSLRMNRFILYC